MKRLGTWISVAAIGPVFFAAAPAAASEQGSHGFSSLIPYFINFSVYIAAVYFLSRKAIASSWQKRRQTLHDQVATASSRFEEASNKFSGAQGRLAVIDEELAQLEAALKAEALSEEQAVLRDAEQRVNNIMLLAQQTIEAERRAAQRSLRAEITDTVIGRARTALHAHFSGAADKELRRVTASRAGDLNL
jgi:F0F1-type ATP synthase membrane subunit b/b'